MPSRTSHQAQPAENPQAKAVDVDGINPPAIARLRAACERAGSLLSVGLEPSRAYLPADRPDDLATHERFLMEIVEATAGLAAAYKFNLAFFEAMGPDGFAMLHRVRKRLPADAYVIADAKRGDIGTTAERYAAALYETLGADSATVNPLMGRDSVEPFLAWGDRLTFILTLTSNSGADDFLMPQNLYLHIAERVTQWATRGNAGLVVGATRPALVGAVRAAAPHAPFLVPGIGAQGGEIESVVQTGALPGAWPGLLFHVTRGILPGAGDSDAAGAIRRKSTEWRERINTAAGRPGAPS